MYKIILQRTQNTDELAETIFKISTGAVIPVCDLNRHYQEFLEDVNKFGTDIVSCDLNQWMSGLKLNDKSIFPISADGERLYMQSIEEKYREECSDYKSKRVEEYPDYGDQFDMIFHHGLVAWQDQIQQVKNKYPKIGMDPTELQLRKDKGLLELQEHNYLRAMTGKFPYKKLENALKVIEKTPDQIKNKYSYLPNRS